MSKTNKKIIWITGASSGIGEALAYEYAKSGSIVILSSRNEAELTRVQAKCNQLGGEAHVYLVDLADQQGIIDLSARVLNKFQGIDLLINNGGISQRSLLTETSLDVDRKIMEVNYFGTIALTKAVLPSMIKNKSGHIVVISSVTGKFGFPLRSSYAASKHALHGFFETLRAENKEHNIRVTIVCPGRIKTNISVNALTKNGTKHGIMDPGQEKGTSAQACARKIKLAVEKNKKEVYIAGKEMILVYIRRFFPGLYYKIVPGLKPT